MHTNRVSTLSPNQKSRLRFTGVLQLRRLRTQCHPERIVILSAWRSNISATLAAAWRDHTSPVHPSASTEATPSVSLLRFQVCIYQRQAFAKILAPQPDAEMLSGRVKQAARHDHDAVLLQHIFTKLFH